MYLIKIVILTILFSSIKIKGVPIESCSRSVCTTLVDCHSYMLLLHNTPRSQKRPLFIYLRSQECGVNFDKRMPMVCCYNSPQKIRKKYVNYDENKGQYRFETNDRIDSSIDWRNYDKIREGNVTNKENQNVTNERKLVINDVSHFFDDLEEEAINPVSSTKFKFSDKAYDLNRKRRGTVNYGSIMLDIEIR